MRDLVVVRELVGALRVGEARAAGGLALVPIFGGRRAGTYLLAEEAIAAGLVKVGERGGGVVPELEVRNLAPEPVLFLEGEHLVGAKQDRVLNVSVLVPANTKLAIPVSCVEAGRWAYRGQRRTSVERASSTPGVRRADAPAKEPSAAVVEQTFATPEVRWTKLRSVAVNLREGGSRSDQGAVWHAVEERLVTSGTRSQTSSLRDAFVGRARDLDQILAAAGEPQPEQTGVLACIGGRPVALDLLDRPEALARLWPRLVRAYALDALGRAEAAVDGQEVERFLGRLRDAQITAHDAVGLGTEVVLTASGLVGSALVWERAVVHLAAFADGDERAAGPWSRSAASPIERGRGRRRPRGWSDLR